MGESQTQLTAPKLDFFGEFCQNIQVVPDFMRYLFVCIWPNKP